MQQGTGRGEAHLARRAADHAQHRRRQTAVAEAEFPVARREAAAVAVVPRARELHLPKRRDEGLRAPPGVTRQAVAAVVASVPPRARQPRPALVERSAFSAAASAFVPRATSLQVRSSCSNPAASGKPSSTNRAASPSGAVASRASNAEPGAPFFQARRGGGRPGGARISRR